MYFMNIGARHKYSVGIMFLKAWDAGFWRKACYEGLGK